MSILIIYAHPEKEGFCSYILENIKKILINKKIDFEILDLYKISYDPILKKDELYTSGNKKISKTNKIIQDKIKKSEKIIFIYPVWWGSMPGILKGFLDRIFTPGFGFSFSKSKNFKFIPKKNLRGKKALVFMTAGSPRIVYFLTANPPKRMIKTFTLGLCGIETKVIQIFNAKNLNEKKKNEIKKKIKELV